MQHTPQTLTTTDLFDIYGVRQAVFLLRALGDTANADKYSAWADALTQAARDHTFPQSGWVTFLVRSERDVPGALSLLRLSYARRQSGATAGIIGVEPND